MGAVWGSRRGYYKPGYGYSGNEIGEHQNAWGETVFTGGSGVYDANGKLLPGKLVTADGVVDIGQQPQIKLKKFGGYVPQMPTDMSGSTKETARTNMSPQTLYQIWKQGGRLNSEEIAIVQEYLQTLKLEQAAISGSYGGGGGTTRSSGTGKNRYKKTSQGVYDNTQGKYLSEFEASQRGLA